MGFWKEIEVVVPWDNLTFEKDLNAINRLFLKASIKQNKRSGGWVLW